MVSLPPPLPGSGGRTRFASSVADVPLSTLSETLYAAGKPGRVHPVGVRRHPRVALVALIGIAWLWPDTRVQIAVVAVFIALTYYAATYIPQL
jgi:hypothetical protein